MLEKSTKLMPRMLKKGGPPAPPSPAALKFGTMSTIRCASWFFMAASWLPPIAVIEIGTSWTFWSRRCAVTTISSFSTELPRPVSSTGGAGASCAAAGPQIASASGQTAAPIRRCRTVCIASLPICFGQSICRNALVGARARFRDLRERAAVDLVARGARHVVERHEQKPPRNLEARHARSQPVAQHVRVKRRARPRRHKGHHELPAHRIGHADDHRLDDLVALAQRVLDFLGRDIGARRLD